MKIWTGLQVELLQVSCGLVQLLKLNGSILGLPFPLLPAKLSGLRRFDVDLLVGVLVVQQLQLPGQANPTLKKNSGLAI